MPTKTKAPPKAKTLFAWRGSVSCHGVPAQVVGEELARLGIETGDCHRASDILDSARDPDSPLHGCFDWDDEVAAEKYRKSTARQILRSIAIVIVRGEVRETLYAYVHIRDAEGPRYVAAKNLVGNDELRSRAIAEICNLLDGIKKRLQQIMDIPAEMDSAFETIKSGISNN